MVTDWQGFLRAFEASAAGTRPGVVTIARSAEDAFTPPASVDTRQSRVLRMLEELYGALEVHNVYLEDEYMA